MLSKRERNVAIFTAAAVGIFLLDRVAITPIISARDSLAVRSETLQQELDDARKLMSENRRATARMKQLRAASLLPDLSATESVLLKAMGEWSSLAGLAMSSIRPDRAGEAHGLNEITFGASGAGTMRSVTGFIYRLETSDLPVRVRELQIASRTDATDDLTVQMRVSTLSDPTREKTGESEQERSKP